jgi:hypothetical protein
MLYEIKSRYDGRVLFSLECGSLKLCVEAAVKAKVDLSGAYLRGADLRGADLSGADLRGAYLRGADLYGADLRGAYLRGADLYGADLRRAYLRGADLYGADLGEAKWRDGIILKRPPIQIHNLENGWPVTILDEHMEIGCELHTFDEWRKFKDSRIKLMDKNALAFWKWYGPALLALCKAREAKAEKEAA